MTEKGKKVYGLIIPKKAELNKTNVTGEKKASVFGEDSSDEEVPTDWRKKSLGQTNLNRVKKQTQLELSKAYDQDPTVFQYDEVFENMEAEKAAKAAEAAQNKKAQEKKPRYIASLIKHAEIRNRERERRIERMVQKEREAEGNEFADKESFVTSAYRQKMEEMQKQEEEERKQDQIEEILNVTKQRDMSGFYRHLYRQTMGEEKGQQEGNENANPQEKVEVKVETSEVEAKFSTKKPKPRAYRKTQDEDSDGSGEETTSSQSSDEKSESDADDEHVRQNENDKAERDRKRKEQLREQKDRRERRKRKIEHGDSSSEEEEETNVGPSTAENKENMQNDSTNKVGEPYVKKDKSLVWVKVTHGRVFEEALQRYLQRKSERNENFW